MASIFVKSENGEEDYYPLGQRTNVVGRDEALPIQILDKHVSRKHMQIRFDKNDGRYCVLDMKSKHGVFVNGRRINGEAALSDGDYIRAGETVLLFTTLDFKDKENALSHFKKIGERINTTLDD
jgi:pSer/pThr/pTyr-binding forkhead associated (FHA) protein